jgi:hypothetical protein
MAVSRIAPPSLLLNAGSEKLSGGPGDGYSTLFVLSLYWVNNGQTAALFF